MGKGLKSASVLIIKLGALGDFIQALGPMAAIRSRHKGEGIVLLTTRPYYDFAEASGYADQVWLDQRPELFEIKQWLALRRVLRNADFKRVYDLQTSDRSCFYYRLFFPNKPPEWSGIARGCSLPHGNPDRDNMHTVERQREQMTQAGVDMEGFDEISKLNLSWASADISVFGLPKDFALLVPGGAEHRPDKRWGEANFKALAAGFMARGHTPVLLGGVEEAALIGAIATAVPGAIDLAGRTDLLQLAELSRGANFAVGNDTGPMHLITAIGCKSVVLYSHESDPALCGQRGRDVTILRRSSLAELSTDDVFETISG